jgi:hypothetical protein
MAKVDPKRIAEVLSLWNRAISPKQSAFIAAES